MKTKDPFNTPVTDLNLRDWAALLPKPSAPRAGSAPSVGAAADIIRIAREQKQLQSAAKQLQAAAVPAGPPQLPTWAQITAQDPGYKDLPYSEQSRLYEEFMAASKARLMEYDPKLDEFAIDDEIRELNPGPVKPERSWTELAVDVGTGVASGAVGLAALPVAVADAISGEQSDLGRTLEGAQETLREMQSPVVEDSRRQQAFEQAALDADEDAGWVERRLREAQIALSNLNVSTVAEILPQIAGPGLVGLGARVAARAAAGATAGRVAGVTAASGAAGTLSAGDAASGARDAVRELTDSELRALPEYGEAMDEAGGDEERAREILSQGAGRIAAAIAGPLGVAFAAVPGSLETILSGTATRTATRGAVRQGARASVIGGVDEALTSVSGNIGQRATGLDTDLFEGTGGDFALGALLEGGTGTLGAAVANRGRPAAAPGAPGAPAPTTTGEILADLGAMSTTDPGAATPGSLSFNLPDGGTTLVVEGADGLWGYADAEQTHTPGADEFIAAMNTAQEATTPPAMSLVAQGAFDYVMALTDEALLSVEGMQSQLDNVFNGDIQALRESVARQAAAAATTRADATQEGADATQEGADPAVDAAVATMLEADAVAEQAATTADAVAEQAVTTTDAVAEQAATITDAPVAPTPAAQAATQPAATQPAATQPALPVAVPVSEAEAAIFDAVLPQLEADFSVMDSSDSTPAARLGVLRSLQEIVSSIPPATRVAIRSGALQNVPAEITRAVNEMGLENSILDNPDASWTVAATQPTVPGQQVLAALSLDPQAGAVNQLVARALDAAFNAAGIAVPTSHYTPTRQRYRGVYSPSNHAVTFNPNTTANTVVHEMMHGLTVQGLNLIETRARNGDVQSANLVTLLETLRAKLEAAAGRPLYGTHNVAEMFAEMVRPEFMAVAMNTPLGDVPQSATFSGITGNPAEAVKNLSLQPTDTVFDAIVGMIRAVIQAVGGTNIPAGSIAEVLAQAATEVSMQTRVAQNQAGRRARLQAAQQTAPAQPPATPAPAQPPATPAPDQAIVLPDAELPPGLRRASTRYQRDSVRFANDIDRAAYIAANSAGRRSIHDARYLQFVQEHTGWTESQVRAYGDSIRIRIRSIPSVDGTRFVESQPVVPPTPAGAREITTADMASPDTVAGLQAFATQATQAGLTRSSQLPSPGTSLATLISQDATTEAKQQYLIRALEQGLELNESGLQVSVSVDSGGAITLSIMPKGEVGGTLGTVYLYPGSDRVSIDSTGFEASSGRGGKFYDAIYGAIAASRMRAVNGVLTAVNKRRIPVNRLRSILKWGTILGDMRAAAQALRTATNSDIPGLPTAGSNSQTANGILGAVAARVAAQAELNAPEAGPIRMTLDGRFTAGNGRVFTYEELVEWARSVPITGQRGTAEYTRTRARRAAATPDALAMAGFIRSLAEAPNEGARQAVIQAAIDANQRLFDADTEAPGIFDEQPEVEAKEKASVPNPTGAPKAAAERNAAGQAEAESIVGDADAAILSPREDFQSVLGDAQTAAPAAPASIIRGLRQGIRTRDGALVKDSLSRFFSEANERFHDSLTPVNNWLNSIVNSSFASEVAVNRVRDAVYLAPGRRDHFMNQAMLKHGGRDVQQAIGRLAKASRKTEETVVKWVGYWLTAERAPVANRMLIDRATQAVTQAQRQLAREPSNPALQQALVQAVTELKNRVEAVNNPDVSVTEHSVNLAGGVSNAQAIALRNAVEANFTRAQIMSVAAPIYRMNAFRLALDIETGKTDPEVAGRFLQQPELVDRMVALRDAAQALNSADPASVSTLDALRDEIANAVRSNYVPLTGDPTVGLDADLFPSGSAAPNVRADRAMQGRRSIPDDGITASLGALTASTAFAGWRPFQEAVANLYSEMTPEARGAAGFGRRTLEDFQSGGMGGIVYRTNGRAVVFTVRDANVLGAIKKANIDDVSNTMRFLGLPTKTFAYAATQLNPFFAPRNWLRDLWERSEIVRTRDLLLPDGSKADAKKIAQRMWSYGFDPRVFTAAARFAAGRPDNGSRAYRALVEMSERGGLTTFGDQFSRDRRGYVAEITKSVSGTAQLKRAIAQVVDVYNRLFDLVPVVSAYMAMQDFSMDNQSAAAASLDTMNFRKSGTAMPLVRALYAFAQPAVTGGANIMSSLYNRRTGKINYRVGVPRLMGYTVSLLAIHAMARSIADDDEGGNKLTQLSDWVLNNTIAFPVGDKIVTIPLAFGIPRIANGMARAMLDVGQNEQTASQAVGDMLSGSVIPAFSPISDVNIDFNKRPGESLMATFAPTWLKPIVGLAINRTDFDAPIEDFRWEKTDQFRSEQYGENQAPFWNEAARTLRQTLGMDLSPNQVKHVVRGYALGLPGLVLSGAVDNPFNEARGKQVNDPITGWLVRNSSDYAIRSQFYRGLEETDALLRTRTVEGSSGISEEDRKLLTLRSQWDAIDASLRKRTAAITRNKGLSEKAKDAAKEPIRKAREAYQTDFVRRMRTIKGQPVGRSN